MELKKAGEALKAAIKSQKLPRAVFLLGILGIVLIYLSSLDWGGGPEAEAAPSEPAAPESCQRRLEEDLLRVVRAVTGEGSPQVMITLEDGGRSVYAQDSSQSTGETGQESQASHVVLEDGKGAQQGLALAQLQPEVKGVVIVSQGAGDPALREKLINAARTALGVPSSRVCVVEGRAQAPPPE